MARISFTANLARHVDVTTVDIAGQTLKDILDQLFSQHPQLKPYIVDEQGNLRKHIMLAIDQELVQGDVAPYLKRTDVNRLHIMQALSGG